MSDNQVSEMRVSVIENLVKQLLNKVKVLEDILKKNEIDTKETNDKIDEALTKHMTPSSDNIRRICFECIGHWINTLKITQQRNKLKWFVMSVRKHLNSYMSI